MHRRTNSYSYTASEPGKLQPPPVISKRYSNSQYIEELQRNTEERRSYRKSTANLLGNRGYRSLKISQAFPATIRFSVNTEDLFVPLPDMYRPRSPNKSPKTKQDTFCVPVLDNALTAIKDQLLMMKVERNHIVDRMDTLLYGIHEASEELRRKQIQTQRSPGQALRRIHSLESRTNSYTQLSVNSIDAPIMEISDCSSTSTSREGSPSDTPRWLRRDSLPAKTTRSVISFNQSPPTVVRRNSSLSKRGSPKGLATIHDNAVITTKGEDSSSDDSTPQSSPTLSSRVAVVSPESSNKVLVSPRRSNFNGWTKSAGSTPNFFYTLPTKRSSTPTSPLYQVHSNKQESDANTSWDKASLHSTDSSTSMIMRVSSATGQLEKVPKSGKRQPSVGSTEHLNFSYNRQTSLPSSSRLSVSSYFIGPDFEDTDGMILNLTEEPRSTRSSSINLAQESSPHSSPINLFEEPRPTRCNSASSTCRPSSRTSSRSSVSSQRNSCILLNSIETTV